MSDLRLKLQQLFGQSGPETPEPVTPSGYSPISQFDPQDVFIVGYPKSGNTWFQNLVAGVVYGIDPKMSPPALVDDVVPDVHYSQFYRRYSTPMFFKSHALPQPDYRRVVYLLRDGRDAMVSYHRYRESVQKEKLDFMEFVTTGNSLFPCKWHDHVEGWAKNPFDAQILHIKYEELLKNPVELLERFCEFINLPRERLFLEAVAESAKFDNLRQKEVRMGMGRPDFPADQQFFRRGKAGSHKDEMPPEVLTAFLREAGDTLGRNGYLGAGSGALPN